MNAVIRKFAVLLAALALGGCLISEEPLLDANNGRGRPLVPGLFEACDYSEDDEDADCKNVMVARDATGLYRLLPEADPEDEALLVRFKRIARGAWLAQFRGEDDDDYFYFVGVAGESKFVLTMIQCEDLPAELRDKYVARGEMEVEDDYSVCMAKTLRAAKAAAKVYIGANPPPSRAKTIYKRLGDLTE